MNPRYNDFVTLVCNDIGRNITPAENNFLKQCYEKQTIQSELITTFDFPCLTNVYFRQLVFKLKPVFNIEINSRPRFFSLKYLQPVTKKHTRVKQRQVSPDFEKLLQDAQNRPKQLHDIQLSFKTSNLYENLLKQPIDNDTLRYNSINKQFLVPIPVNAKFNTKAQISTKGRVDLFIGCSQLPLDYHPNSFAELSFHGGQIINYLTLRANSEFLYQPVYSWVFERYHLNRDTEPIVHPLYRYSIGDLQNHSYFYIKKFEDGTIRARYEQKINPKTSFTVELEKTIYSQK